MNCLFFGVCIPIRLLLVYLASTLNKNNLRFFGIILLVIALGFLYLYFANKRLNAAEATGGVTWWSEYRLIHGLLYLCAAIYAFQGKNTAWIPLLIDVGLGVSLKVATL
jgi:hypothetical protein